MGLSPHFSPAFTGGERRVQSGDEVSVSSQRLGPDWPDCQALLLPWNRKQRSRGSNL